MLKIEQLEKEEDYDIQLPKGDRSKSILEPMITEQWFVKTETLAKEAIKAVETEEIKFVPKNWEKTYFEWMYNIQDWCISRQIWWGHRIPAWYDEDNNIYVGNSEEEVREKNNLPKEKKLRQDEDVLDTWFSSALWPFSTLGWPEETEDLNTYYPTSLLVVGFDIIFFWVARMIMMGIKFQKAIPFKDILVHGLVRDSKGRKMSKSLGNTVDPLELSEKHGADALRFSLVEKASPGQDVPFDEEWTVAAKKFGNKIWNASKFVHIYTDGKDSNDLNTIECEENKWIITKFNSVLDEFNSLFEKYKISDAYKLLYNFLWSDLFDWYFEFSKNLIENDNHKAETMEVLNSVFLKSIKILNPAMPHITEEVWETFNDEVLISNQWPEKYDTTEERKGSVEDLKILISKIRNFKATYKIKNNTMLKIYSDRDTEDWFKYQLESLAKVEIQEDTLSTKEGQAVLHFNSGNYDFLISAEEYIDVEVEITKLNKKIRDIEKSIEISNKRLENEKFMNNAKPELIDEEKLNKEALETELNVINETLKELGN